MKRQITEEITKWIGETSIYNLKEHAPILTETILFMIAEKLNVPVEELEIID